MNIKNTEIDLLTANNYQILYAKKDILAVLF